MARSELQLVPDCRISVSGAKLDTAKAARLASVLVDLDAELFGMAVLTFNDPKLGLIDGKEFASGVPVKVEMGFSPRLSTVFEGEVTALEPQFRRDQPAALKVICHDEMHRLALSQMTRAFNDVDDHEVVSKIAQEHGLSGDAPHGTREHVLQANVTDAAFLRRLAQKHGAQLRIESGKLTIAPPKKGAEIALSSVDQVRKIRLRVKSLSQVGEVTVHGWDPKAKREIVATARPEGETGEGAKSYGGSHSLAIAGSESLPADTATAEAMAKARLAKLAEGFVTAEIELIGDPRAVPGAMLKLDKVDPGADGTWRIDRARHEFSRHGYFVRLSAVRTAKKKPPPPPRPAKEEPASTFLEIELLDHAGNPVPGQKYRVQTADGRTVEGKLDAQGKARIDGLKQGNNQVSFPGYSERWHRA